MTTKRTRTATTDETEELNAQASYRKRRAALEGLYERSAAELESGYAEAGRQLAAAQQTQRETASVNLELLKKYLPTQNEQNGLRGLGVSETATLDAYNRYLSQMGGSEQSYAAKQSELTAERGQARAELEETYQARLQELDDAYRAEVKQGQEATYAETLERLAQYDFHTAEELDRYLKTVQGSVSAEQYQKLLQRAESYKTSGAVDTDQARTGGVTYADGANSYNASLADGEKFKVRTSTGRELWVESRGAVADDSVTSAAKQLANGTVFLYGRQIYLYRNGTVYSLSGTGNNNNTGHYRDLYELLRHGQA